MKLLSLNDLPEEHHCNTCGKDKPIVEMMVVHNRKSGTYQLRPRCKSCHNEKEKGHRREWKTQYLQRWRRRNKKLVESYWKDSPDRKEKNRIRMAAHVKANKDAIAIQRRLRTRLDMHISLLEAKELLGRFGHCYPSRYGLTREGLRECERIRSRLRKPSAKLRLSAVEIRMMVYEDGLFITPSRQPRPYEKAARNLRNWWQRRAA